MSNIVSILISYLISNLDPGLLLSLILFPFPILELQEQLFTSQSGVIDVRDGQTGLMLSMQIANNVGSVGAGECAGHGECLNDNVCKFLQLRFRNLQLVLEKHVCGQERNLLHDVLQLAGGGHHSWVDTVGQFVSQRSLEKHILEALRHQKQMSPCQPYVSSYGLSNSSLSVRALRTSSSLFLVPLVASDVLFPTQE